FFCFFFSSRRRHTRSLRDWSSDVCSSDLMLEASIAAMLASSIRTGTAAFTFGIPLAIALASIPMWFYWAGIPTPDQSLIPQVPRSEERRVGKEWVSEGETGRAEKSGRLMY